MRERLFPRQGLWCIHAPQLFILDYRGRTRHPGGRQFGSGPGAAQGRLLATGNFYGIGYREMDDGPRFFAWIGNPDALGYPDRYRSVVELTAHEYEALQKVHPPEPILADDYQFANFRRRFFEGRALLLEPWTM